MSEDWISARKAAEAMWPGKRPAPVPNGITKCAEEGLVEVRADLLTKQGAAGEKTKVPHCFVPNEFWGGRAMVPDWQSGVFTAKVQQNGREEEWKAFGVTFKRSQIEAMAPLMASTNVSPHPEAAEVRSNRVGRSPNAVWERVMIELARQLYAGDLQPNRLADVEKAIADFLSAENVSMMESTIRQHARPFWKMYESEAGK